MTKEGTKPMITRKRIYAVSVALLMSAGLAIGVAGAGGTPAPGGYGTSNCANGIYSGYCGTQESGTSLYIAVGSGGRVIGTANPQASNAEILLVCGCVCQCSQQRQVRGIRPEWDSVEPGDG